MTKEDPAVFSSDKEKETLEAMQKINEHHGTLCESLDDFSEQRGVKPSPKSRCFNDKKLPKPIPQSLIRVWKKFNPMIFNDIFCHNVFVKNKIISFFLRIKSAYTRRSLNHGLTLTSSHCTIAPY